MSLNEWKELGGLAILVFSTIIILMYLFITLLEIKLKKCKRQQITYVKPKNILKYDYKSFIKANCDKSTFLYENRNREIEMIRLLNY